MILFGDHADVSLLIPMVCFTLRLLAVCDCLLAKQFVQCEAL